MSVIARSPELEALAQGTLAYARTRGISLAAALARQGSQFLLGDGARDGLFALLADTAPVKGHVTAAARARGWRTGDHDSRSLSWARQKAGEMLAGRRSAAFRIVMGEGQGGRYIASIQVGKISSRVLRKKVRRRGEGLVFGTRSKTARLAYGQTRETANRAGGVLLNQQALAVALTQQRRERSRLATAAQFLPRRYRTQLVRIAGAEYRSGQLVGVSSTDAAMMHHHVREVVKNRKGTQLGSMEFVAQGDDIRLQFTGLRGIHTARQAAAINQAAGNAAANIQDYLARKSAEQARATLRAAGLRVS